MPKRKDARPTAVDADPYQIEAAVADTAKTLKERHSCVYDGVMGDLPDWIPKNFRDEFTSARNRLLGDGYTADQVRDLIAQEMRQARDLMQREKRRYDQTPDIQDAHISYRGFIWPPAVAKDISLLAHLKTAVRLKSNKGLAFLTDPDHAKKVNGWERYRSTQSTKAKHPRGKLPEADGKTIDEIIGALALRRPDDGAKELWNAFYGDLGGFNLEPQDEDVKMTYLSGNRRKSITLGTFIKRVSEYRTRKRNLP